MWNNNNYKKRQFGLSMKKPSMFNRRKSFTTRRNINEYFYKRSSLNWQNKVLIYFFIVVLIYIFYFFLFSHYFRIENVIVEGNTRINKADIENIAKNSLNKRKLLIFKNNNYFLFSSKQIKKELTNNNVLEDLMVKRRYLSSIFVYIKEKDVNAVYQVGSDYLLIDKVGNVISKVDQNDTEVKKEGKIIIKAIPSKIIENQNEIDEQDKKIVKDNPTYKNTSTTVFISELVNDKAEIKEVQKIIPVEKDSYPSTPDLGANVFTKENLERISYINESMKNKFPNIKITEYQFETTSPNIIIGILNINAKIYFKLDEDLEAQVANLYKYLIEEKHDLKGVEYIDLRQKDQLIIK